MIRVRVLERERSERTLSSRLYRIWRAPRWWAFNSIPFLCLFKIVVTYTFPKHFVYLSRSLNFFIFINFHHILFAITYASYMLLYITLLFYVSSNFCFVTCIPWENRRLIPRLFEIIKFYIKLLLSRFSSSTNSWFGKLMTKKSTVKLSLLLNQKNFEYPNSNDFRRRQKWFSVIKEQIQPYHGNKYHQKSSSLKIKVCSIFSDLMTKIIDIKLTI